MKSAKRLQRTKNAAGIAKHMQRSKKNAFTKKESKMNMINPLETEKDFGADRPGAGQRMSILSHGAVQPNFPSIRDPYNITSNYMEGGTRGSTLRPPSSRQTTRSSRFGSQSSSTTTVSRNDSAIGDVGGGYERYSRANPKLTQFEVVKKRIDKTIRNYEQALHNPYSENANDEEKFLLGITSKMDKVKNHMMRIDIAMLVDRYRRLMERFGVNNSKHNEEVDDKDIEGLLDEIEEWVNKANEFECEDAALDNMNDETFSQLINVDHELMVEDDLAQLKDKFRQLGKMNRALGRANNLSKREKALLLEEKQILQNDVADKLSANNQARNNNAGFMHAADEIFHLMEKSRAEGGGKDAARYQEEVAAVLRELVKRDQLAGGQSKKMKSVQAELDMTKTDFNMLIAEHKTLKVEVDSLRDKYDKACVDLGGCRKKILILQKNNKDGAKTLEALKRVDDADSQGGGKALHEERLKTKRLEETLKVLENKYNCMKEDLDAKDHLLQDKQHQLSDAERRASQMTDVGATKGKKGKAKRTLKPAASLAKVSEDGSSDEQIAKLKSDLSAATQRMESSVRNEQLISQSLAKREAEMKQLQDQYQQTIKKLDFQSRELEMVKANLEVMERQNGKAARKVEPVQTGTVKKMKACITQTEANPTKNLITQCDIPAEEINLGEIEARGGLPNLNLSTIIQILNHKAGITDVARVLKFFKKTNEREVKQIQIQICGGEPLHGGEQADLSFLESGAGGPEIDVGALGEAHDQAKEAAMCFLTNANHIGEKIGEMMGQFRSSFNIGDAQEDKNRLNRLDEMCEEIEFHIDSAIPGFGENLAKAEAKSKGKPLPSSINARNQLNQRVIGRMAEMKAHDFRIIGQQLMSAVDRSVDMFSTFALDECQKMNIENRNLRKRLANKTNMGGYANDSWDQGGDTKMNNPDKVLDDIENILQSRLSNARKRSSVCISSQILNPRNMGTGGLTVKSMNTNRGGVGNMSIKSDPLPSSSVVQRKPSVMSIMRSMGPKTSSEAPGLSSTANRQSITGNFGVSPMPRPGTQPMVRSVRSNQRVSHTSAGSTQHSQHTNGGETQRWMGRFERELQQTKLRNRRAQANRARPELGIGLGLMGRASASQQSFHNIKRQGNEKQGNKNNRLESMLTSDAIKRNRLNPVFGSNLPRNVRNFR